VRVNHRQFLAEAQPGTQQRLQLPAGLERLQAPDGAQDPLMHLAAVAKTLHDLQVGI